MQGNLQVRRTFASLRAPDDVNTDSMKDEAIRDEYFAQVADTDAGKFCLAFLREITIEQDFADFPQESALQSAEAKRQLVRDIERWVKSGRERRTAK